MSVFFPSNTDHTIKHRSHHPTRRKTQNQLTAILISNDHWNASLSCHLWGGGSISRVPNTQRPPPHLCKNDLGGNQQYGTSYLFWGYWNPNYSGADTPLCQWETMSTAKAMHVKSSVGSNCTVGVLGVRQAWDWGNLGSKQCANLTPHGGLQCYQWWCSGEHRHLLLFISFVMCLTDCKHGGRDCVAFRSFPST